MGERDYDHERRDYDHERRDDDHERRDYDHERRDDDHERRDDDHERRDDDHERRDYDHERRDSAKKPGPYTRRYLAVRIRKRQQSLFADGSDRRHFAVVTNRTGDGLALLRWHRLKAGTVEHAHDAMKNDLAGAALPSGKFGANAAWWRLTALTFNLLSVLKQVALPGEFRDARPKRLRFSVFHAVSKVVHHARRTLLRLAATKIQTLLDRARTQITRFHLALARE